ncbi:MAG: RnfABCDGE type electron transport complex subunit D [Candidatus Latescibacter sp.]|nr:RnfABCDGE type electron transport complex subunit D [Candidatus Latescibacter sp.]
MARMFDVSATPHLRDRTDIPQIMYSVVAALMPALFGAVYFFGVRALWIISLSVLTCVAAEGIIQKLLGKPPTIRNGSAIVTGILLAFNLPSGISWWIPVLGGVFAIGVAKMTFGGLGYNPMNPALIGRVFLLFSFPVQMTTTWQAPTGFPGIDAQTTATPLNILKENSAILHNQNMYSLDSVNAAISKVADLNASFLDLFLGNRSGCIGETSVLLLLIGAAFLMYKRYIGWKIPFSYIATVGILSWIFGGYQGLFTGPWLFHVLSGGLILGAFFMATDMVTSPITFQGRILFGIGCGVITVIIRLIGGFPEGVAFSILLMNLTVPLLDRLSRPKVFGKAASHA